MDERTDITARKPTEDELRGREAALAEAQAVAGVGTWDWDLVRDEVTWSEEVYRIFGVGPGEFEPSQRSFIAALHPDDRDRVTAAIARSLETGDDYEVEYRVVRPDGEERMLLARAQVITDLNGEAVRMVGAGIDVTETRAAEERLDVREALLRIAQEITRAGSFEWDIAANSVTWSDGLYTIFGLEPGESPATFEGYLERVHPDEREQRKRTIEQVLETGEPADGEHRIVRSDGEVRWIESRIRVLTDEAGAPIRLMGVCQDITERRRTTQELEDEKQAAQERALHDPLTGLPNRTLAFDRLEHAFALALRRGSEVGVLFIDIDGFKRINDRFGHARGDEVLRAVAERMAESVRGSDTVARIGGDEFLVICEEVAGMGEPLGTAERVLAAFEQPFDLQGSEEPISLSIGISSTGDRQLRGAVELIDEADGAMYEAKRRGPGGIGLHPVLARTSD